MKSRLIIAPHADDAEFGMGIAIQRFIAQGDRLHVAVISISDYRRCDGRPVRASDRVQEAWAALTHLGARDISMRHDFPENEGREWRYSDLVAAVEMLIEKTKATHVYTCLPSFNQDHQALYDATITATRPPSLVSLYAYEYPGNSWGPTPPPSGRLYIAGSDEQRARKIEALEMHKSQFDGRSGGVSPLAADALARWRGTECGAPAADLLYAMRVII